MTFNELLKIVSAKNAPDVCIDSRLVKAGDIFVAIPGTTYDGYAFIDSAVAKGARYIVSQKPCRCGGCEAIVVKDAAEAAGLLAQSARGNPAFKLINMAVTGTNGKTTITFLVRSIVQSAGLKCGLIGTIICDDGKASFDSAMTTPDCLSVAKIQQQMVENGAGHMVIEASSHALDQNRLAGVSFKSAAFTNLTGDHLDYHRNEENYLAAKMRLFSALPPDSTAVLNKQSPASAKIAAGTNAKVLWYAVDEPADIKAGVEKMDITGTVFTLEYAGGKEMVRSALTGRYNISNHLAAAGLALAAGFDLKTVACGLSALRAVPGRVERVEWGGDFSVFVDYAHTDDALKNVLSTLRPLCKGRLIAVFGCGGDRDKTKRPRMAAVTENLADFVMVTSDNPRTEDPQEIIRQIMAGFKDPDPKQVAVEPDRKKAIETVLSAARKGDIVLIAGKGHETYQIIGRQKSYFSDQAVALEYLGSRR